MPNPLLRFSGKPFFTLLSPFVNLLVNFVQVSSIPTILNPHCSHPQKQYWIKQQVST